MDFPMYIKKKLHLDPIVNTTGGPTYNLAKHLAHKLKPFVGNTNFFMKYSTSFVIAIKDFTRMLFLCVLM